MIISNRKIVIFLILFLSLTLLAKVYLRSASEYNVARGLRESGREMEALARYDRAMRWYLPFNPHSRKALEAVWEMALKWEEEGESDLALQAYRDLRGGIQGARSLYIPYRGWSRRINLRIAALEASTEPADVERGDGASFEERKRESLERLKLDRAPSVSWSVIAAGGFMGWVISAIFLALSMNLGGVDVRMKKSLVWGLLFTVCFAFWLVGMARA